MLTRTAAWLSNPGRPISPLAVAARFALYALLWPIGKWLMRAEVEGLEQLDSVEGPVIFAANHQSHTDSYLLVRSLPPRFRDHLAIAIAHLGDSALSRLRTYLSFHFLGMAVVSHRPGVLLPGLDRLCAAARRDCSILIYPEGERSHSNRIAGFFPGVGWLARELRLPVVPVYIENTHQIRRRLFRVPVRLRFGPPLHLRGNCYREFTRSVEQAVRDLAASRA